MRQKFTEEEFNTAKGFTLLPIECLVCGEIFYKNKYYIKHYILNPSSNQTGESCSPKCSYKKRRKYKEIVKNCFKCGRKFKTISGKNGKKCCSIKCAKSRKWSKEKRARQSIAAKNSIKVKEANLKRSRKLKKICPICEKEFIIRPSESKKIYCSRVCYNNDIDFKFKNKSKGGCRKGSGRGKSGWYKEYWCDSSYELVWVIYHLDHKIKFERNKKGFEYIVKEKKKLYYPDFIKNKIYYEIKGYKNKESDIKISQFPHKIKILYKKDLKDIFEYVENKYGRNFIELYEGNPYNEKNNICEICGKPAKNKYCSRGCSGAAANLRNYPTKSNALEI